MTRILKPFNGVTGAPAPGFGGPRPDQPGADIDISADYKRARIDVIRTHDEFGPGDIDARFGVDKKLPADIPSRRKLIDHSRNESAASELYC